ncbi:phospholipase D/nuclease [Corynespora cassiicola Philippines]|uniref:Phospholipase D/nuclease n=1 Tax=Corynespora cassiicola Philippines TaxID=1448308 RepID=A0A2T2NV75_CORCC|nr:phospholipase D/nuclease [Corynespora cassiicola Philippines]
MVSPEPDSPPSKRQKLSNSPSANSVTDQASGTKEPLLRGLDRPISPPIGRKRQTESRLYTKGTQDGIPELRKEISTEAYGDIKESGFNHIPSPIQLTRIQDLAPVQNHDTVSLSEILGNPMIKECWNFNFLFDLDFVKQQFDSDVRELVQVKIVHGFWRNDDERKIEMLQFAERNPNFESISAYMPNPFGTHHSKMVILIRHDELAQVIVHTANMIPKDWMNMTQAVWRSPLLPVQSETSPPLDVHPIGTGERFKTDLLRYLNAYGKRLSRLVDQLVQYDFSAIRAAFIGSVPAREKPAERAPTHTSWGWQGLQEILSSIPSSNPKPTSSPPNIVTQVSSIATLGPSPTWLKNFQSALSCSSAAPNTLPKSTKPTFNIVFPTAAEIRASLDGYASGGSIHTKIQSTAQRKQLEYLQPLLCHWNPSAVSLGASSSAKARRAERGPAAPHIKTYIRFGDAERTHIDWAVLSSANLSKQAWGDVVNKKGEVWVQSYETGVVVWPELFRTADARKVVMVPVSGKDMPGLEDLDGGDGEDGEGVEGETVGAQGEMDVVGFRMPYDLPLVSYGEEEVPWCASESHMEPDWKGVVWQGY